MDAALGNTNDSYSSCSGGRLNLGRSLSSHGGSNRLGSSGGAYGTAGSKGNHAESGWQHQYFSPLQQYQPQKLNHVLHQYHHHPQQGQNRSQVAIDPDDFNDDWLEFDTQESLSACGRTNLVAEMDDDQDGEMVAAIERTSINFSDGDSSVASLLSALNTSQRNSNHGKSVEKFRYDDDEENPESENIGPAIATEKGSRRNTFAKHEAKPIVDAIRKGRLELLDIVSGSDLILLGGFCHIVTLKDGQRVAFNKWWAKYRSDARGLAWYKKMTVDATIESAKALVIKNNRNELLNDEDPVRLVEELKANGKYKLLHKKDREAFLEWWKEWRVKRSGTISAKKNVGNLFAGGTNNELQMQGAISPNRTGRYAASNLRTLISANGRLVSSATSHVSGLAKCGIQDGSMMCEDFSSHNASNKLGLCTEREEQRKARERKERKALKMRQYRAEKNEKERKEKEEAEAKKAEQRKKSAESQAKWTAKHVAIGQAALDRGLKPPEGMNRVKYPLAVNFGRYLEKQRRQQEAQTIPRTTSDHHQRTDNNNDDVPDPESYDCQPQQPPNLSQQQLSTQSIAHKTTTSMEMAARQLASESLSQSTSTAARDLCRPLGQSAPSHFLRQQRDPTSHGHQGYLSSRHVSFRSPNRSHRSDHVSEPLRTLKRRTYGNGLDGDDKASFACQSQSTTANKRLRMSPEQMKLDRFENIQPNNEENGDIFDEKDELFSRNEMEETFSKDEGEEAESSKSFADYGYVDTDSFGYDYGQEEHEATATFEPNHKENSQIQRHRDDEEEEVVLKEDEEIHYTFQVPLARTASSSPFTSSTNFGEKRQMSSLKVSLQPKSLKEPIQDPKPNGNGGPADGIGTKSGVTQSQSTKTALTSAPLPSFLSKNDPSMAASGDLTEDLTKTTVPIRTDLTVQLHDTSIRRFSEWLHGGLLQMGTKKVLPDGSINCEWCPVILQLSENPTSCTVALQCFKAESHADNDKLVVAGVLLWKVLFARLQPPDIFPNGERFLLRFRNDQGEFLEYLFAGACSVADWITVFGNYIDRERQTRTPRMVAAV